MEWSDGFTDKLRLCLKKELPGTRSQSRMAPAIRLENRHGFYRNAAVMILLYKIEEIWQIVLMKRPEYAGTHSNQISLPGGIHEKSDPDMRATALRETREELGIDDSRIRLLGSLSKLHIPVSGIEVFPFVGAYSGSPVFDPDPSEVAYLIEVPLPDLLSADNAGEEIRTIRCKVVTVPYFSAGEEKIWGATAMILSEFLDVIRSLDGLDLR
jgi:8-oxo-dGTP pyrophosphatase MutT (NUDIX family)